MRFNSNFGIAIHALLIIDGLSKKGKVTSKLVADRIGTNSASMRVLLGVLKNAGLINVAPRKEKDGTTLSRPLGEITVFDVFKAVEPNSFEKISKPNTRLSNRCYSGIYTNEIIDGYIGNALDAVEPVFSSITLADTLAELEKREALCPVDPRKLFED